MQLNTSMGPELAAVDNISLINPLVSCASKLLLLLGKLRHLVSPPNATALRSSTAQAVQNFDASARQAGLDNETVIVARYVLCTALDEAVSNTPWGVASGWTKEGLLVQFHNETHGGEKVFHLLARLTQDVPRHLPLIELIYCVISLGFQGRYHLINNGGVQLEKIRARLAEMIRNNRPPVDPALSPHWRGEAGGAVRLGSSIPLWLLAAIFALLLALSWFGLRLWLNQRSDDMFGTIVSLRSATPQVAPPVTTTTTTTAPAVPIQRLARFLQPEINEGLVTVTDEVGRSTVRLTGDRFFSSGSADPMTDSLPVLRRIGAALAQVKGQVLITGHTDNQPIRSLRYPSNWNLSNARAQAVMAQLTAQVEPARMSAQGKADAQPIAANDTPANRARNRRVEIVLVTGEENND
jgi:type VI secretion system protein ImpK